MIYLKEANFEDIEKEWQYIAAMPEDENGLTNQWPDISREDFEKTALPEIIKYSKGIDMPDEVERLKTASAVFLTPSNRTRATSGSAQVAETFLFLWDDDTIVGLFRLRQYLNDALREGSGHIGYGIGKAYRGKGYGTKGLALTLEYGKNIIPEDEFYLRVNKDNPASLKVMIKNGGRIVSENDEKYFVRIKKMTHTEKAVNYFSQKLHCSQSVLAAFADECGITEEQAIKLGSCFGTGMRKGEVCGAVTGALMVLGLLYGQNKAGDADGRQRANKVDDLMMNRFKEKCGSYLCNDLLGCDVRTMEGVQHCLDNKLFTEFCPKMVAAAVEVVEGIIEEMK